MSALQPNELSHRFLVTNIISGTFMLLAAVCVIIRLAHHQRERRVKWDDWAILAAFITGVGAYISGLVCAVNGYHAESPTIPQLNTCSKTGLAGEVLYTISVAFAKISVLLFYKRIFYPETEFVVFTRVMTVLVVAACVTYMFGLIFTDTPAVAHWNVSMSHTSINAVAFYETVAAVNILIDVVVIGYTQLNVWRSQMSARNKFEISGLLFFAVSSVVVGILRVVYTGIMDHNDATYTLTLAWLFATLELFLYIICGCLPIVYNLFRSIFRGRSKNDRTGTTVISWPVTLVSNSLEEKRAPYHQFDERTYVYKYISRKSQIGDLETQSMEPLVYPERALSRELNDRV
ncbi:uncharacterized protein F4812DRAFT_424113 [Daldinia caldariorum]|uniref:uncharacterized protein n=1 Tax=Daldinia caldariorum TaxID=326644 RepID=UPI002007D50C|nr:uncharacterized protein F4812DRAFT_424113 [Daldinia caldariorum]KAI1468685.1 hypothetical protein F4812DRAFT_424113 [Daldinia caldariorum]